MRNISFALTTPQFIAGTKLVTRRIGWRFANRGDVLCAIEKGQGLKRGEKVKRLGLIRITECEREMLSDLIKLPAYGRLECVLEGFPGWSGEQFVEMFCKANKCEPSAMVTRIRFERIKHVRAAA